MIRETARREWRSISLSLLCNLVQAAAEGATLGVMFLAVDLLSKAQGAGINWSSKPVLSALPQLTTLLSAMSRNQVFVMLLGVAVGLKLLQCLAMYVGSVAIGYYGNRTSARLTNLMHSRILGFSFACASRWRVGELQFVCGLAPNTVINEINFLSGLVLQVLMLATYLLVLINLSPLLLVAAITMAVLLTLVQRQLLPRIGARAQEANVLGRELTSRMTENIQGLRLLHTSGQLDAADQAVAQQTKAVEINQRAQTRLNSVSAPIIMGLPILMIAAIAGLSVVFFGERSSGVLPSLVTFVVALQRLNGSLGGINQSLLQLKNNSANVEMLND